jgi:ABC-type Co2+ transport system permease subunit
MERLSNREKLSGQRRAEVRRPRETGMDSASEWGALRITLLFGAAAVALALIAAPLLESRGGFAGGGLDMTSTGSIGGTTSYTIRRSVLQSSPDAVCIILADGARSGDC